MLQREAVAGVACLEAIVSRHLEHDVISVDPFLLMFEQTRKALRLVLVSQRARSSLHPRDWSFTCSSASSAIRGPVPDFGPLGYVHDFVHSGNDIVLALWLDQYVPGLSNWELTPVVLGVPTPLHSLR